MNLSRPCISSISKSSCRAARQPTRRQELRNRVNRTALAIAAKQCRSDRVRGFLRSVLLGWHPSPLIAARRGGLRRTLSPCGRGVVDPSATSINRVRVRSVLFDRRSPKNHDRKRPPHPARCSFTRNAPPSPATRQGKRVCRDVSQQPPWPLCTRSGRGNRVARCRPGSSTMMNAGCIRSPIFAKRIDLSD